MQGFRMEPVEAMHFGQPDSGGDWLRGWEQQQEPRRRTVDSSMSFQDAPTLAPRRQAAKPITMLTTSICAWKCSLPWINWSRQQNIHTAAFLANESCWLA